MTSERLEIGECNTRGVTSVRAGLRQPVAGQTAMRPMRSVRHWQQPCDDDRRTLFRIDESNEEQQDAYDESANRLEIGVN